MNKQTVSEIPEDALSSINSVIASLSERERRPGEFSTLEYCEIRGLTIENAYKELLRCCRDKTADRRKIGRATWWKYVAAE